MLVIKKNVRRNKQNPTLCKAGLILEPQYSKMVDRHFSAR